MHELPPELDVNPLRRVSTRERRYRTTMAAIDRAVRAYDRKRKGLEPWTDFLALVPASVREAQEKRAA